MEGNRRWLQTASVIAGSVLLVAAVYTLSSGASMGLAFALAGVGIAAEVWPYKKAKARKMWASHLTAVEAEKVRRAELAEMN